MRSGLTTSEAKERLARHGFNELPSPHPRHILHTAGEVMKEPMFLLLISCAILYIILGDFREGIILLCSIFIIIGITFFQSRKTEKALEALKNLSSPRALVIRDGAETRIPGREVVPDDIVLLHEGDRVPADAVILEAVNLTVDESMLTGEAFPVNKSTPQDSPAVYSGTMVLQGKGLAKVLSTGTSTQFGKIGTSLKNIEAEETRLQKEMKKLIRTLFILGVVISVGVVLVYYFTRFDLIHSLLTGLAASMAILPEEFPVVLTIFLALGSWRLSRKNVLTRKPSAIETLGSATVLCSDKTGTITQNIMEVAAVYDGKELYTRNAFKENHAEISPLIGLACRACSKNPVDPMEKAIHQLADGGHLLTEGDGDLLKEFPLSKGLFAMTRVLKNRASGEVTISSKGAPEAIFKLCRLGDEERKKHLAVALKMAENGYRVLAVATGENHSEQLPEAQSGFAFTFAGLVGLEDPVRPEVPEAIQECKTAGIRVIMITGDFPPTAKCIGAQIGLDIQEDIITGEMLDKMSDEVLSEKINTACIFARIVPEQKLRIVQALKARGEVVAMTGDGVNDAPALKAADIGVAMGKKGTDVARESASLVLLDDNFASIVSAIRSGRKIFDNLQKAMSYIMAIHIPIIGLTLLPAFIPVLPLFLMPLHIIFMELIIDPISSVAFEAEQEEKGIMQRPPRQTEDRFFGPGKILLSIFEGLLLLGIVLAVYFLSIGEGHTDGEVRAIAFSSLIVGNVFLVLSKLSQTRSFVSVFIEKNVAAILIMVLALCILALVLFIPTFQEIFNFEYPGIKHFIPAILASSVMLAFLEIAKFLRNKRGYSFTGRA